MRKADPTKNPLWSTLKKSWAGFKRSKGENDFLSSIYYATLIVETQGKLGVPLSTFQELSSLEIFK